MIAVTEQSLGNLTYRGAPGLIDRTDITTLFYRAAISYITGTHALKAGFTGGSMTAATERRDGTQPFAFRMNNGVPNRLTQTIAYPRTIKYVRNLVPTSFYGQDQWTSGKLTLQGGVRYDYVKTRYGRFATNLLKRDGSDPRRFIDPPIIYEKGATGGVRFHDITPRMGVAYDLFGTGKTAVSGSVGRYVQGEVTVTAGQNDPAVTNVNNVTRTWNDTNFNLIPDCDLTNRVANGECGAMDNRAFGTSVITTRFSPDVTEGWFVRPSNWQTSIAVQHELRPGIGVNVGYFRTSWRNGGPGSGDFHVTDNLAVSPNDMAAYTLTAPRDPRLPATMDATCTEVTRRPTDAADTRPPRHRS